MGMGFHEFEDLQEKFDESDKEDLEIRINNGVEGRLHKHRKWFVWLNIMAEKYGGMKPPWLCSVLNYKFGKYCEKVYEHFHGHGTGNCYS